MQIFLLILVGAFLRFYNLDWGNPFYFHPDERNIAASVSQLNFPNQMNPHFFAYGSFPIYLIYFTGFIINFFLKSQDLFIQSVLISRFYSAILSLLITPSIYYIGKKIRNKQIGFIAAILCTFSIGFIQFAHFGTFEIWLTFLALWFFYFSYQLSKNLSLRNIFITGTIFGILMATKISSFPLVMLLFLSILLNYLSQRKNILISLKTAIKVFTLIFISFVVFTSVSPYVLLDFNSFRNSINYESSVALGILQVFYTGEFFNTIPAIFQFTKIYPFLINPVLTILFLPSFFLVLYLSLKKKNYLYLLLIACYLLLFIPQAFLFAKWTRYIVPTLPFIYLIIAIALNDLLNRKVVNAKYLILSFIIFINIIFAISYFITAFVHQDTRIAASVWAKNNIPNESKIVSEVYDMGIVPFNQYFPSISLFNFYDLDQDPQIKSMELEGALAKSDYIILPSPRILKTRLLNQKKFPYGYDFYNNLTKDNLGYKKIYETRCDIFCKIIYLGNPVFSFEQTTNVFDHPTVFIFKKI